MLKGKYAPLFRHLVELCGEQWSATFVAVETILGDRLPKSARRRREWWANGGHSHARAWQAAGWLTKAVDLAAETLVFERAEPDAPIAERDQGGRRQVRGRAALGREEAELAADGALALGGRTFRHVTRISPEAGPDGEPVEYMPQRRYHAAASTPMNRHGHGPFCRFSVAGLPAAPGVYAVTVEQKLAYVGIAASLKRRWGPSGYAQIQPRNCFKGGQSTNCKVNHAILVAARDGLPVRLWMHQTATPRPIEAQLIAELSPPWNAQR